MESQVDSVGFLGNSGISLKNLGQPRLLTVPLFMMKHLISEWWWEISGHQV